jgi:hypothetical protein
LYTPVLDLSILTDHESNGWDHRTGWRSRPRIQRVETDPRMLFYNTSVYSENEERREERWGAWGSVEVGPGRFRPWNGNWISVFVIFVKSSFFILHLWNIFFILLLIKKFRLNKWTIIYWLSDRWENTRKLPKHERTIFWILTVATCKERSTKI